jgi:hypothetical protein
MGRAKEYAEQVAGVRCLWSQDHNSCWVCGYRFPANGPWPLQTHEMVRRSKAPLKWGVLANYFRTCQECHEGPLATMSLARQLAYKKIHDPDCFMLGRIRELCNNGRNPTIVDQYDVEREVRKLLKSPTWE